MLGIWWRVASGSLDSVGRWYWVVSKWYLTSRVKVNLVDIRLSLDTDEGRDKRIRGEDTMQSMTI